MSQGHRWSRRYCFDNLGHLTNAKTHTAIRFINGMTLRSAHQREKPAFEMTQDEKKTTMTKSTVVMGNPRVNKTLENQDL